MTLAASFSAQENLVKTKFVRLWVYLYLQLCQNELEWCRLVTAGAGTVYKVLLDLVN